MIDKFRSASQLMKTNAWKDIWAIVRIHWKSDSEAIGLRRDVTLPFAAPQAAVPITIRKIKESDVPFLFGIDGETLSADALRQRSTGMRMTRANLATCYVAVGDDDRPYYVQWLIGSSENKKIHELFDNRFPALGANEMLLEGAFTLEAWRGKGIMAAAMSEIAGRAGDSDAQCVITFVMSDNVPSLKGCAKAGFVPFLVRRDRWRFFRRRSVFSPLPESRPV